jgi:hypothetical protein
MATGWMIGVLVEGAAGAAPTRQFFAVAQPDRARAEWAAADRAMLLGAIASSPHFGHEPVDAVGELNERALHLLGLGAGQIKALGDKWPRRWLPAARVLPHDDAKG